MFNTSLIQNKVEIYSYIGIIFAMIALPIMSVIGNSLYAWIFLIAILAYMVINKIPGVSTILIAIFLCMPQSISVDSDISIYNQYFVFFYYAIFGLPLMISAFYLLKNRSFPYRIALLISTVFLLLLLAYGASPIDAITKISCIHLAFYIGYNDKMDEQQFFKSISLIFIITAIYAILEYHFFVSPYSGLYLSSDYFTTIRTTKRAVGLLGNPLILTSFTLLYQAVLTSRLIKYGKIPVFLQLLCLYILLIVVSRTAFFALIGYFIIYKYYSRNSIKSSTIFSVSLLLCLLIFFVGDVLIDAAGDLVYRFNNANSTHRASSFEVTYNILSQNPFGIGIHNVSDLLLQYSAVGKEDHIGTLDNFFLSQFAYFGIFGIFVIYNYLLYFFKSNITERPYYDRVELIVYIYAFLVCGFCFDFEAYNTITFVIYSMLGLMLWRQKNTLDFHS